MVMAADRGLVGPFDRAWLHAAGPDLRRRRAGVLPTPAGSFRRSRWCRVGRCEGGTELRVSEVAIKVESVADFSRAHDLGLEIAGNPMGPYRVGRVAGDSTTLAVVERRGYRGFEPYPGELARAGLMKPHAARDALAARDLWHGRRRRFEDDEEGIAATEATLEKVIEIAGSTDLACHLIFEGERAYWESRNRAARVQKARQDRLGLGWANHDHHTFRCSRRFFPRIIAMFTRLGFELRERFHAGAHAGWGAQIVEHPVTGIVIFADLDLAPDEATEISRTRSCRTYRARERWACGWPCMASRSSKPACITWRHSSTSTPCATGSRPRRASRQCPRSQTSRSCGRRSRRASAGRSRLIEPIVLWPRAGSTPSSTRSSSARGRSAATWKTSNEERATRDSTSRRSAPSSRRRTRGCIERRTSSGHNLRVVCAKIQCLCRVNRPGLHGDLNVAIGVL